MNPTFSPIASQANRSLPQTDIPSEPLSGPAPAAPAPQTQDNSRAAGDRQLAMEYHAALLRAGGAGTDVRVNAVAPHSTFGQWREQLKNALQLPGVLQWVQDKGIDITSLILNTQTGEVSFKRHRHLDPEQKLHTVGQEDRQWAAIREPILHAAQVICTGHPDTAFVPQAVLQDEQIPGALIARFYLQEPPAPTASGLRTQAQDIIRNWGFKPVDADTDASYFESRSEDALLHQKALSGDILNRERVIFELHSLAKSSGNDFEEPGALENRLKQQKISLSADRTYPSADDDPSNEISVFQFLQDHGWDIPTDHDSLVNLATALSTPPPTSPPNGNLGGALAWPVPLDAQSRQHLKADIHTGKFGNILVSPFKNVLEYLLNGRVITSADLADPRKLIDSVIAEPRAKALGEAIQTTFEAREVKGSANDWLLAALGLESNEDTGDGVTIEGYRLLSSANRGKTASTVVKELEAHLLATGKASSVETAALLAHMLLASRAPEFLVKGIPDEVVIGSHSWVSFATAGGRMEEKAPGSTSGGVTYSQIMLEASIAPISEQERQVEYSAQNAALKEWALANGRKAPLTPDVMTQVREAFNAQLSELQKAADTPLGSMPTVREIALEQLKKALPHMDPKLFEEKSITVDPPHKRYPGPYSILDSFIDGRPLFWTPNRAEFWAEEARNIKNIFVSEASEEQPDSRPAAWVSSSKEFDLQSVLQTLKTLPRPKELFQPQIDEFLKALKTVKTAQLKKMFSNLPDGIIDDLLYGKITPRTHIRYHRADHPKRVEEGIVLYDVERNGKTITYAIDRINATVTPRPDQTYSEYPPKNGTLPQLGQRYDVVKPAGEHPPGITDERTGEQGAPDVFKAPRIQYIIDTLFADMKLPEVEKYAGGATTFDTEVPLHETIEKIVLGLVPFKSAIENLVAGNTKQGLLELAVDIFGFVVAFGAAYKGLNGLARSAVGGAKLAAGKTVKIIGRSALSALNPVDGVTDLGRGALKLGKRATYASYKGIKQLRSNRSVDLLKLAKRPDIGEGTYKLAGNGSEIPALAKMDDKTGKAYLYNAKTDQPYGKPIDFTPHKSVDDVDAVRRLSAVPKSTDSTLLDLGLAHDNVIQLGGPVKDFKFIDNEVHVFYDTYKTSDRLNIVAHGKPYISNGKIFSRNNADILINGRTYSAEQLVALLKSKGVNPSNFDNIRLLICHSAEGGSRSFGAQLQKVIKKPVKAFEGPVFVTHGSTPLTTHRNTYKDQILAKSPGITVAHAEQIANVYVRDVVIQNNVTMKAIKNHGATIKIDIAPVGGKPDLVDTNLNYLPKKFS